ncbi:MAG TPA: MmcQ/YjbR family DNA-binding protein [Rhizomicrobium sp.]|jgi:hypothetical protein|nr:MmcQ/YjbR family DNA-binding protein [Rhizomicrobium sp.]
MSGKKSQGLSAVELRRIALSFPATSEGTSYGKPSFLVAGKFFTRLRSEDDSFVLIVGSIDERDMLLESDPALFHITEHYRNYPAVLARRTVIDAATLRGMLERRWRVIAPKKLAREYDGKSKTNTAFKKPEHPSSGARQARATFSRKGRRG